MKKLAWTLLAACVLTLSIAQAGEGVKTGQQLVQEIRDRIRNVDTATLQRMLAEHPDLVLVDVRTPDEVRMMGGTIAASGNVVIPRGWLEFRIQQYALDAETPIVVYCGANVRSPLAAWTLQQMGYRKVFNYKDGFIGWRDAGLPVKQP